MKTEQRNIETAFSLAFNMKSLAQANNKLGQWIKQEGAKERSRDLPTDVHKETVKTMHELVSYFVSIGDTAPLTAVKNVVIRIFLDLDACILAKESLNYNMNQLSTYVNLDVKEELEHEQN